MSEQSALRIVIIVCSPDKPALFDIGEVYLTIGAKHTLHDLKIEPVKLIKRHITGDWGELPHDDIAENKYALKHKGRILSSYQIAEGVKVWVITEAGWEVTTLLLPSEY